MVEIIKFIGGNMEDAVLRSKEAVLAGKTIIYPTDTVYGIGGDALNQDVVERVRKIKGMEKNKPLSVMMADIGMIEEYCEVGLWEEVILKRHLPGPFTFVLKKHKEIPVTNDDTLGVRVPEFEFCNRLCDEVGRPVITTSANRTGEAAPTSFDEIKKEIVAAVDVAIDRGATRYRRASDVVDLVSRKIMRKGVGVIDLSKFPEP
jgi:L-threonylcarbamoyladenylate synthase